MEAHEGWLDRFKSFSVQEIGLHGYEHGTSTSYENAFHNIEKGLQLLRDEGMEPTGFCAPYGIWNQTLDEVLQQFNFGYSSEFTLACDGLPFYPSEHLPLQIPIHPVCTGSLSRKRAPLGTMKRYFEQVLENKIAGFEPVIFYHHPMQPGLEVWDSIFGKVNDLGLTKLTFRDFAAFWEKRTNAHFEAYVYPGRDQVQLKSTSGLLIQQSKDHSSFSLNHMSEEIIHVSEPPTFEYGERYLPSAQEIESMRSYKLDLLKTSFLDWKNRKRI